MTERGGTPDDALLDRLPAVEFEPVFIMGDHRSGTTLLYQLLDRSRRFNTVTAYHIICYDELLANHEFGCAAEARAALARRFDALGLTDRRIDGVQVTPDLPEEYGFLLHGSGERPRVSPRNLERFLEVCRKVQYVSQPGRPLLLKNPWDYFRNFMYIKAVLPRARFIFLSRHPARVVNSQLKATRAVFAERNDYVALIADWYGPLWQSELRRRALAFLFSEHLDLGLRLTRLHVARGIDYLMRHLPALPAGDHMTVRYEDLCDAPDATIAGILAFLDLEPEPESDYAAFIEVRQAALLPEVAASQPALARRLAAFYRQYGYVETAGV